MACIGTVNVQLAVDTKPLEIMRDHHAAEAVRIQEIIDELKACVKKDNEDAADG